MEKWLLNRLLNLTDQPDPRFAYQSTVNWMTALAMICKNQDYSTSRLQQFYATVQRRSHDASADTIAFHNILMAVHNLAALSEFSKAETNQVAIVRSAVIAWYYAIYYSCSAMIAAASGTSQESHSATWKAWHNQIVRHALVPDPFGLSLDTLIEKDVKSKVKAMRNGRDHPLVDEPRTLDQAWGAAYGYLSGTAAYEKWKAEERVRNTKEFKILGVKDFRTSKARELRDAHLGSGKVNFLVQAFRYRGKANYRDSIFLSYGENRTDSMRTFCNNLSLVAAAFMKIACFYTSRRVEKGTWRLFADDLQAHLKVDLDFELLG